MAQYGTLEHEAHSVSIQATGTRTSVPPFYVNGLRYLYHCIHCTTLGPELLSAAISPCMIELLRFCSDLKCKGRFVIPFLMFVLPSAAAVLGRMNYVPEELALLVCVVTAGLFFLLFLCDVVLYFFVDIPMQFVWDLALTFPTQQPIGMGNEFFTLTFSSVQAKASTDLRSHVLLSYLETQSNLKIMLYKPTWRVKNYDMQ